MTPHIVMIISFSLFPSNYGKAFFIVEEMRNSKEYWYCG
jgi:hypothetical protein